jgi:ABC-type lipoprotein export system ATPase subunit
MNNPILRARGLHKSFVMGHETVRVLRGAALEVKSGEFLAVMGASGSGKSTLLHILGTLDIPDRGNVEFEGRDIFTRNKRDQRSYRNQKVGFVFQFYHLLPELNVLENVVLPQMVGRSWWRWDRRSAVRLADEIVERVGLSERRRHRPHELSGGERQRVAIARALVNRPSLLLADEPTGNLDEAIGADILSLLVELNEGGQTIVMVTHDPRVASAAHRRVQLGEGVLREIESPGGTRSFVLPAKRKVAP